MLTNYFGLSPLVSWVGLVAVGIGLTGVYYGAFAAWLSWLAHRQAASPLVVAAGWGVCEFARANLLIGNPWALSGYSQVALTRLMQIADATGPYGVGMLIAAVNACLAGLFTPALRGRRPLHSCVGIATIGVATLLYGEWRLSQTFVSGEPIEVAVIQGAIERQLRWDPEHREANLGRYLTLTKEVALARPRLIFWPENAVDFYLQEDVPEREAVLSVARDLRADLILGGPYYGYGVSHVYYHNSVFLIRRGKLAGRYDKIRLLPFAETDQFRELFSRAPLNYKPGRRPHALRSADIRIGAFVCFEAMYPDLVQGFALQGAEVLANPSNDDWFDHAAPARHQLDIATVRAIENRRYLVRPTAAGFSAIIDPYGRAVALSGFATPEVLTASVYPSRARTLYQRWGDAAAWIAVAFVTTVSLFQVDWLRRKQQRR
jgi:apolipoprotein N-acyltransferase